MNWHVMKAVTVSAAFALLPGVVAAQEAVLRGRVTSESGSPIGGASVFLEQMNLGAVTNDSGAYQFRVPGARVTGRQATLTARLIGFKPQSKLITLNAGTIVNDFVLPSAPIVLQQMVITGEGTITPAEKLGNRVDNVRSDLIVKANEQNVTNALAGKAPNIQVQSQSGDPGSSTSIQIRGLKTLTGDGQPLFVVDGVPIDNSTISVGGVWENGYAGADVVAPNRLADLNPNDIESVTILKGSSAGAIYGARAAQGVVLITTKSGKSGTTRYSFRSSYSFDDVNQGYDLQRSFGQGVEGHTDIGPGLDIDTTLDAYSEPRSWGAALAPGTPTFDHFHEMFTTGHIWDNSLSISGGDDRRTFFLSGGRSDNEGFIEGSNDDYKRNTLRLKATQRIGERIQIGGNVSYVDSRGAYVQRGDNVSGIMLGGMRTPPEFDNRQYLSPVTGLHRSYRFRNPSTASLDLGRGFDNPFFVICCMPSTSSLSRVYGNLDLVFEPTDWLKIQEIAGGDYYTDQRLEVLPKTNSTALGGQLSRGDFTNYILDHNLIATASHTFNPSFAGSLTLGQNLNATNFQQVYELGSPLAAPEPFSMTNTITVTSFDQEYRIHRESYFGQATIDLFDQLYLTGALRNDGFSTFGESDRRHWFPKASASWTFSKVIGDLGGKFDFGKLRLAYGQTGREPLVYSTLTTFNVNKYYEYGGVGFLRTAYQGQPGLTGPDSLGSNNLKPERTREWEAGLDFGLFRGFADANVTYYNSRSKDVIFQLPTPPSAGHRNEVRNAAVITNKGVEVNLNLHPLRNPTVAWDLGFIWGLNRNKVREVTGATEVLITDNTVALPVARPGYQVSAFEGYDFVRCGRGVSVVNAAGETIDIDNTPGYCQGAPTGALYITETGFPVIDDSLRILGGPEPRWSGSVRNTLTFFKKIELSALVDIRRGNQGYDGTRGALYNYGTHKDTEVRGQTFVFGPSVNGVPGFHGDKHVAGPGAGQPVVIDEEWFRGDGSSFSDNYVDFIEDAGFVKLREISVAYTFDQPWIKRNLGLNSIDLRLSGRNLHTWTDYRGIDPEQNGTGASTGLVQGVDWFNNPQTRSIVITVGLNR